MGLFDMIRGQLIDVIEWLDPSNDTMVYRYERHDNEIKYGAKLIVRESQVAVFIHKGQLADVFAPGTHTLETQNIPILTTLMSWPHGFNSPFKAEVYFVNTKRFTDLKWGTKNPIMLRDPEFGPVRLRAYGTYAIRVMYAPTFIKEIAGTDGVFTSAEITNQLRNLIVARFSDILGESKIPILDLAANYSELGKFVSQNIIDDFDAYGLQVTDFTVENISLPPGVEEALDKRTSMGILGDMNKYSQYAAANAMEKAAENPGGMASGGMGMAMGVAMAGQVAQAARPGGPPPVPGSAAASYFVASGGQQAGPYDVAALQNQARGGQLTRDTLVWCEGMVNWEKAGSVPALSSVFSAMPPPLPPSP
ncbi:MAG: hypothetical protein AMXMBFR84_01310 [Candidatus Hydrogenedentota bacterium]